MEHLTIIAFAICTLRNNLPEFLHFFQIFCTVLKNCYKGLLYKYSLSCLILTNFSETGYSICIMCNFEDIVSSDPEESKLKAKKSCYINCTEIKKQSKK